jgi:hypothetical protein
MLNFHTPKVNDRKDLSKMTRLNIFFLFMFLTLVGPVKSVKAQVLLAQPETETIEERQVKLREANQLITKGRPSEAIPLLQELNSFPSGIVYYNLGVAYQFMGEMGESKAMFMAASSFPETKEEARIAIEQVDELLPFKMASIPRYPWQKIYDYLIFDIGVQSLIWIGAFTLYLTVGGLLWAVYSTARKKAISLAILSFSSLLAIISILSTRYFELKHIATGVITTSSVTLVENPDLELESTNIAYEGAVVKVDLRESRLEEGWHFVTLQNGAKGWLMESSFKTVPFY